MITNQGWHFAPHLPHPTGYHYFTPGKLSEFKVKAFMKAFSLVISVIALNGTVSFDKVASALEKPQTDLSGNTIFFTMGRIARMLLLGVCNGGKEGAPCILTEWFSSPEHVEHPYPTAEDKIMLMRKTGINEKQLTDWFKNARRRIWKPMMKRRQEQGEFNQPREQTVTSFPYLHLMWMPMQMQIHLSQKRLHLNERIQS